MVSEGGGEVVLGIQVEDAGVAGGKGSTGIRAALSCSHCTFDLLFEMLYSTKSYTDP